MTIISYIAFIIATLLSTHDSAFQQQFSLQNQATFILDDNKTGHNSRQIKIESLKQATDECIDSTHCADLHFHIAELYLSYESPDPEILKRAEYHLNKVKADSEHAAQAKLLRNMLTGWMKEIKQKKILENHLKSSKAVDLKTTKVN